MLGLALATAWCLSPHLSTAPQSPPGSQRALLLLEEQPSPVPVAGQGLAAAIGRDIAQGVEHVQAGLRRGEI